jgi:uncharacterized repeat protein (TIGR03803 family)
MKTHNGRAFLRAAVLLAVAVFGGAILAQAQTLTTIHSFTGYTNGDGEYPYSPQQLPFDSNGALYGTTAGGGSTQWGTVFQLVPPKTQGGAWTENVIYTFLGNADGAQPQSGVVFGQNGNLYGTTYFGGNEQMCGGGCGTVFELSPPAQPGGAWIHTVIYTFQGRYDGQGPGEVVFGPNGALYSTTFSGGTAGVLCMGNPRNHVGCGTVFELTPPVQQGGSWTKTILHNFPIQAGDGQHPSPEVVFDSQGNLYGTAGSGSKGHGMVFELTPPAGGSGAWTESVPYNFTGGSDGAYPGGGVVPGPNGVLYGTASQSGGSTYSGVVFELKPTGGGQWTETVLHSFPAFKGDGTVPGSTLALDQSGNLYGTTLFGGTTACSTPLDGNIGCGTVFKVAPPSSDGGWTETVLHTWPNNGQFPYETVVVLHNGLLYGTADQLGTKKLGSVFTMVP